MRWRIELSNDFRHFDYEIISVDMHIHYTAREGGVALRDAALGNLRKLLKDEEGQPQARLFSLRHEFPTEWHRLQPSNDDDSDLEQAFTLSKDRFPFMFQGGTITVNKVELFGIPRPSKSPELSVKLTAPNGRDGENIDLNPAAPVGQFVRKSGDKKVEVKSLVNPGRRPIGN